MSSDLDSLSRTISVTLNGTEAMSVCMPQQPINPPLPVPGEILLYDGCHSAVGGGGLLIRVRRYDRVLNVMASPGYNDVKLTKVVE